MPREWYLPTTSLTRPRHRLRGGGSSAGRKVHLHLVNASIFPVITLSEHLYLVEQSAVCIPTCVARLE
jgi:hypothetical protein